MYTFFVLLLSTNISIAETPQTTNMLASSQYQTQVLNSVYQGYSEKSAYCENVYWHPNAQELLEAENCDQKLISDEIDRVQSGRY